MASRSARQPLEGAVAVAIPGLVGQGRFRAAMTLAGARPSGLPDAQVDDLAPGRQRLFLHAEDGGENVGRQLGDAVGAGDDEIPVRSWSASLRSWVARGRTVDPATRQ